MRKFLSLLMMTLFATTMWAATEVTFNPASDKGNGSATVAAEYTITKDGVTVTVSNGMVPDEHYRVYKGSTMAISATSNIIGVTFNCTAEGTEKYGPGNFTASTGTYTNSGKVGTWSGDATSITFTASTAQVRITSFTVTLGESGEVVVSAPTFSPAAGTYYSAFDVAITSSTSGASIYYTSDGTDPTTSSTLYEDVINISKNTTLKAIAVKDGVSSNISTAEYVMGTATQVANIAEYQKQADNTMVQFTGTVTVLAQNGKYLYVKDNTGYMLVYGSIGKTYTNGDVIPAGFTGTKTTYSGEPELKCDATSNFSDPSSNSPVDPEVIQASDVASDLFGHYVLINGATLQVNNKKIVDNSGSANMHTSMGGYSSSTDTTKTYNVYAIIGSYGSTNTIYQVLPTKIVDVNGGSGSEVTNIAAFKALGDGNSGTITGTTVALAQYGQRLYIKDNSGYMLVYGNTGQTYNRGSVIPGGITGTAKQYDGVIQMSSPSEFQASTSSVTVTPESISPSDVAESIYGHLVKLSSVLITSTDGKSGTLTDASSNSCAFYNNMGANLPSDLTKRYDIVGIVGSYGKTNTTWQVLPIEITEEGGGEVELPTVATISDLYALSKGVNAKFTSDMKAIYQNGKNLYVKVGNEYGLVYGTLSNSFTNGNVIENAVANWTEYNGIKELIPVDSTFTVARTESAVQPEEIPCEEISQDMVHTYIQITDATLTNDSTNFYTATDETEVGIMVYNKFNKTVTMPTDLSGKTFDIRGFITVYKSVIEVYPIEVVEHGTSTDLNGDVNLDGKVDSGDIACIVNIITGKDAAGTYGTRDDVNGDGKVDSGDIAAVVAIITGTN